MVLTILVDCSVGEWETSGGYAEDDPTPSPRKSTDKLYRLTSNWGVTAYIAIFSCDKYITISGICCIAILTLKPSNGVVSNKVAICYKKFYICNELYVVVINVSIFLPLILGVLGFILALGGIKGKVKGSLVLLNIIGISLSGILVFIAMYGFQQS